MQDGTDIEYDYQGQTWKFPHHLARLQVAPANADMECRRVDADPDELAAARAKRLGLTLRTYRLARPRWDSFNRYDRRHADRALRDDARAHTAPAP